MDGCDETGITIMKMNEGLDTGDIVLQQSTHIRDTDNFQILHDRLAQLGAQDLGNTEPPLIIKALEQIASGKVKFIPQDNRDASYAQKITREDELIFWDRTKRQIWNQIRALYPGPGAYCYLPFEKGVKMIKILTADFEGFMNRSTVNDPGKIIKMDAQGIHVGTSKGTLIVKELQLEGKKKMPADEFLRGYPLKVGVSFLSAAAVA
jgi:methionyl-tRNA formyltransferase